MVAPEGDAIVGPRRIHRIIMIGIHDAEHQPVASEGQGAVLCFASNIANFLLSNGWLRH